MVEKFCTIVDTPFEGVGLFHMRTSGLLLLLPALSIPLFAAPPDFKHEVQPILILEQACVRCHGQEKDRGEFQLHTRAALMKGGEQGVAVVEGKPDESSLIKLIQLAMAPRPSGSSEPSDSNGGSIRDSSGNPMQPELWTSLLRNKRGSGSIRTTGEEHREVRLRRWTARSTRYGTSTSGKATGSCGIPLRITAGPFV